MSAPRAEPIDPRAYASLGELLRDALVQFKTEVAFIETDRKRQVRTYTFAEVKALALAQARKLAEAGVQAGDRVAIIMGNQPKWLITAIAAFHRGAVLVPLDYKLTADEQAALLAHCKPRLLVTEFPMWRRFQADQLDGMQVWVSDVPQQLGLSGNALPWEAAPADPDADIAFVPRTRQDLATIVYSSGTGGRPKGCMLTHDNYLSQLEALLALFPMSIGDRYFSILPTNHAIDFMCGFVGPMASGATVVHQRTLRPEFIVETMKRQRITHMALVPLVLTAFERRLDEKLSQTPPWKQHLVDALGAINGALTEKKPRHWLSSKLLKPIHDGFGGHLKMLFCGGAFVDRQRAERFYKMGLPVVIGYGLTECCTVAAVNDLKPFRADSVGRPAPGVEIRIDRPDPKTGVGEVLIKGPTVMAGYLDDPELTAETIVDGWLHTGDLGYLDASHHLHLVGRSRNMIVTEGGKNIYPEDIEGAFATLPCAELAVFAANYIWPKAQLTGERLVCVVRPGDEEPDASTLDALLVRLREQNRRLADFKRIDGVVAWEAPFPRTASMKIKRNALAEELRASLDEGAIVSLNAS